MFITHDIERKRYYLAKNRVVVCLARFAETIKVIRQNNIEPLPRPRRRAQGHTCKKKLAKTIAKTPL